LDWHQFYNDEHASPATVDSRGRLRVCLIGVGVLLAVVLGRVVALEITQGEAFREEAGKPLVFHTYPPGTRGRILSADGQVLALDRQTHALAVHYRYLETPPNKNWLRRKARRGLSRAERKDPARLDAEIQRVRDQRRELAEELQLLCGFSTETWNERARRIQTRVERIARSVNRRRREAFDRAGANQRQASRAPRTWLGWLYDLLRETVEEPPGPIAVAEEHDYHVMAESLPLAVVAEIEGRPERYPGVKIVTRSMRSYPGATLAAHVLGHLGPMEKEELSAKTAEGYRPEDRIGRTGLERQYETLLRGHHGLAEERTDRSGQRLSYRVLRAPGVGRDLVLTLHSRLQADAETLLDAAIARRAMNDPEPAGGAIVVMDVRRGAILAAASAPRFDPNLFEQGRSARIEALLDDPARALFDRVARMAIPPGSVFKTVSALALLDSSTVSPEEPFVCQGYLETPDRLRCALFRRRGVGHGAVTMREALAQSCNVYFFYYAGKMGAGPLVDWALRFGFARPTGVDLPGESAGMVPTPATIDALEGHPWRTDDTRMLAIGQGSTTATPLQVCVMMAAVANGGRRVTPHLVDRLGLPRLDGNPSAEALARLAEDPIVSAPPRPIEGLRPEMVRKLQAGLEATVADPKGAAHGTVHLETVSVAGKTGTAQTGAGRADHAWFAGYVPAHTPRWAFVIVIEHGGDGAEVAGPVARRLVLRMQSLGLLSGAGP